MRALRMTQWNHDPELQEIPEPEPGPGEVVIAIGGAGACHSDLHLLYEFPEGAMPWHLPITLGHENAGWVHTLGAGVTGFEVGQPVAVYGPWGCGRCHACAAGHENYCRNLPLGSPVGGLGADEGTVATIRELTHGHGADVVLDVVGSDATLATAAQIVSVEGHIGLLGLGGGSLPVTWLGMPFGVTVTPNYWGTLPEFHEVLHLAARGDVTMHVSTYPLERATEAYAALRAGKIVGRAVVVP